MKKDYSTPEWKLVLIKASDILSDSIDQPDDEIWSDDY